MKNVCLRSTRTILLKYLFNAILEAGVLTPDLSYQP